jgi:hypothetical protein
VKALRLNEVVVRVELTASGILKRILEFEWPAGLQSASLVGTNFQGSLLYVNLGPARDKGAKIVEGLVDLEDAPGVPRLRMRRSRRRLSTWAEQVASLKRDPPPGKETK